VGRSRKIEGGMGSKGLERFKQERDELHFLAEAATANPTPEGQLTADLVKAIVEQYEAVIGCAEEGQPFIANYYSNAPEVFVAMGLPWYLLMQTTFLPTSGPHLLDDIDAAQDIGLGIDMCTLIRLGIYYVEAARVPPPTAFVGLLSPCDGATMLHQAVAHNREWRDVPIFSSDPPYTEGERSIDFFAGELRRMVAFLEKHTGHILDTSRLREVIEESNAQYSLWAEYNELRRAVPAPHSAAKGVQAWNVCQNFMVGDPRGTDWLRRLVEITEGRVRDGKGDVPDERIRLFWFDVWAVWFGEVANWLKDEWKACLVMDMTSYCPYTLIDTSSEESMFKGLAKRYLYDVPMVRQAGGTVDNFVNDVVRVVKDYRIDCVVWPGHMGHKEAAASVGMLRQVCRDLGVPFLNLGLDLFDKRYTTMDEVKDRISQFFTTIGLG
jgi:benzoyl-CoA reductase subunit B